MKKLGFAIYGVLGGIAIVYGIANLFFPAFLVREAASSFLFSHLLREQAAAGIFIGCMSFWCIFNYERRRGVHYFLMVFAFLLAAIHWFDFFAGHLRWMSPLYNSLPFLLLLVITTNLRPNKVKKP